MLTPRYYFADDFRGFHDYFLAQPHKETVFRKGELLWKPGQPYDRLNYFLSGAAVHFAEHETGRRRIISFHGPGTVFPGYHTTDFRIVPDHVGAVGDPRTGVYDPSIPGYV